WGGMRIVQELVERIGLRELLDIQDLPQPGSNRGYNPVDIVMSFLVSIWVGGNRFAHCALLRYDEVLKKIFGWKEVGSESTFSRFFRKFSLQKNNEIFPSLQRWTLGLYGPMKVTLDLDSTVIERYGEQEGSRRGYNPRKPGRPSQHPLIAFIAELKVVANGWLRPGNTSSSNNMANFLEETFSLLGRMEVGLIRADNGFFGEKCLNFFEEKELSYIVAAKFTNRIKKILVRGLRFVPIQAGIEIAEFSYKAMGWQRARRFTVVRKNIELYPKATGKELVLFPEEVERITYRYSIVVTNLELPAVHIWEMYRKRSDSENRIKELKYDFAIRGFSSQKFYATEAAFRFALVAYNVMALFRLIALKDKKARRMATLYLKCIALGSWTISKHRKTVLKLSAPDKKREWIVGLFKNITDFSPPITFSNA
ncbi:MAG: IS1380 family transposase, partial [Bacteroidota bacterium]|nr:IS1380 family transposase [Bacteroidota bacterium]